MIDIKNYKIKLIIAAIGALFLISQTVFIVNEKQTAIILQFGEVKNIVSKPGISVKVPLMQNVIKLDARILDFDATTNEIIASDQRRLLVDAFIKYKITKLIPLNIKTKIINLSK